MALPIVARHDRCSGARVLGPGQRSADHAGGWHRRHLVNDILTLTQVLVAMAALVLPIIVGVRLLDRGTDLYA